MRNNDVPRPNQGPSNILDQGSDLFWPVFALFVCSKAENINIKQNISQARCYVLLLQ